MFNSEHHFQGLEDGSVLKSACCSSREPEFCSQYGDGSQQLITSDSENLTTSGLHGYLHTQIHTLRDIHPQVKQHHFKVKLVAVIWDLRGGKKPSSLCLRFPFFGDCILSHDLPSGWHTVPAAWGHLHYFPLTMQFCWHHVLGFIQLENSVLQSWFLQSVFKSYPTMDWHVCF